MTHHEPIAAEVAAFRAAPNPGRDPEVAAVFRREQELLDERGIPMSVAKPGHQLPMVTLIDPMGEPVQLSAFLEAGPAVVAFYRGSWCPYCNITLRVYQQELLPLLEPFGASLIAVSPENPDGSLSMKEKNELTFTVLSDAGNELARALGILSAPSAEAREVQLKRGLDLEELNSDGTTAIPMPTVVILDEDGVLQWIDVHPNYTTRTEPAQIAEALQAVRQSSNAHN